MPKKASKVAAVTKNLGLGSENIAFWKLPMPIFEDFGPLAILKI